jgi:hypothetical protein
MLHWYHAHQEENEAGKIDSAQTVFASFTFWFVKKLTEPTPEQGYCAAAIK